MRFLSRKLRPVWFPCVWAKGQFAASSFSSSHSITGWRVGHAAASTCFIERSAPLHKFYSSCVDTLLWHGAVQALHKPQDSLEETMEHYHIQRCAAASSPIPGSCRTAFLGAFCIPARISDAASAEASLWGRKRFEGLAAQVQ